MRKCPYCNQTDHDADELQGERGLLRAEICALYQLKRAGLLGVEAGNLADKPSTRELVRRGLADNTGGSPSSLSRVYISRAGRRAVAEMEVDDAHLRD